MGEKQKLARYREKRNFRTTSEPEGGSQRAATCDGELRFVVQMHDARQLHYDFRLEAGGVLKSWAVPKGPSTDPREKRLATPTEDHPLDYENFEGVIARGEYGAGTVLVWDEGTYHNITQNKGEDVPIETALENGHLKFWLDGHKLRGGFALTKLGNRGDWLLVKTRDDEADARRNPVRTETRSVKTGRTLEDIAAEEAEAAEGS